MLLGGTVLKVLTFPKTLNIEFNQFYVIYVVEYF